MDEKQLKEQLDSLEKNIKSAATAEVKAEIETRVNEVKDLVNKIDVKSVGDSVKALEAKLEEIKSQKSELNEADKKAFDKLQVDVERIIKNTTPKIQMKSFGEAFADELPNHFDNIAKVKKGQPYRMELKAVGDMTLSNLTGDSVASYSAVQAILPSQKVNFRDLIPTVQSDTGLYVQYRETGSEGSISAQTEGSAKSQIDYDFTEVKVTNDYIAGFARFSKQMMRSLPWMQSTLPRILLRDFYKAENSAFWTAVTGAATGATTTSATQYEEAIIDYIATLGDSNFTASYVLGNYKTLATINKNLLQTGNYQGAGGVLSTPSGALQISGVPVVPVSWAADNRVLVFDRDYLERVQVEGVVVEFFEQDSDNVQKNKITARIECYEDINLMLTQSAIFGNLSAMS